MEWPHSARTRRSRNSASTLAALVEKGPQTRQLGLRGFGPLALRLRPLLPRWDKASVAPEQPDPVVLHVFIDTMPDAEEGSELLAPEAALGVRHHRHVGAAHQTEALQLPEVRVVQVVLGGPEDPGIEILLLFAVDGSRRGGRQLDDHVRKASSFLPRHPHLATTPGDAA